MTDRYQKYSNRELLLRHPQRLEWLAESWIWAAIRILHQDESEIQT
jgi:hypothetical protein